MFPKIATALLLLLALTNAAKIQNQMKAQAQVQNWEMNELRPGSWMDPGNFLISSNHQYHLRIQELDGNFIIA